MTVHITPDVRLARHPHLGYTAQRCALLTMTCCGAQAQASETAAPRLAELLDGVHSCASV